MASDVGFGLKEVVTWTLTIASLCWNWFNTVRTNSISQDLRQAQFDLDEWKQHRQAIIGRLDDFESAGERLLILSQGQHQENSLRDELSKEIEALATQHEALFRVLDRYGMENWHKLSYGRYEAGESDWDRLNTALAEVTELKGDPAGMRSGLKLIKPHLRSIAGCISERVRHESEQHRPAIR